MADDKKNGEYLKEGDGWVEITLTRPMDVDGAKVATLRMREPLVDDQLAMEQSKGSDAMKELTLVANLCSVSVDDIRKLPLRDYSRVRVGLQVFID